MVEADEATLPDAPQREIGAPPAARRAAHQWQHGRQVNALTLQGARDGRDLPGGIRVIRPMLQGAAAANAEMPAGGFLAIRRRRDNPYQFSIDATAAMAQWPRLHRFAG
ncbi:MAG TPA: hypothetical protein VJ890_12550 [Vineibacter sp.]|nr:hypothetical protein [Vineibacter sp.]